MFSSRRTFLQLLSGSIAVQNLFGAARNLPQSQSFTRRYNVTATVTLLSMPLVSRTGVGAGYIAIEDGPGATAIQFAAGSWPDRARGLNRLGYIKEILMEKAPGDLTQCEYFAFMTSSQERNLEQAKQAVSSPHKDGLGLIPYAGAEGSGRAGRFTSKLVRFDLPETYNWGSIDQLIARVPEEMAAGGSAEVVDRTLPDGTAAPPTFLYAVRRSLLDPAIRSEGWLVYNGKQYLLRTHKQRDSSLGARVVRLDATLRNEATGHITPFAVWFEEGAERQPPLRFEYQARSFLRLTFDSIPAARSLSALSAHSTATNPPITLAFAR